MNQGQYIMATATPWGLSQDSTKIAVGIRNYTTAGHGGIHLSKKRNAIVPEYVRNENGWYEEDCEWAIPAVVFPEEFEANYGPDTLSQALYTIRNWFPLFYEKLAGRELQEGESYIRDKELFEERNKNNYVVISASIHKTGYILGTASIGGVRDFSATKDFLIPNKEYGLRGSYGFVIDPEVHKELI